MITTIVNNCLWLRALLVDDRRVACTVHRRSSHKHQGLKLVLFKLLSVSQASARVEPTARVLASQAEAIVNR